MKTLIYQYWTGKQQPGPAYASERMKNYADTIHADYIFDINPNWANHLRSRSRFYNCFKPVFDKQFDDYDYILFSDVDVIPVDGLDENIFEQYYKTDVDIGICEETFKPDRTRTNDVHPVNNENDCIWADLVYTNWKGIIPRVSKNYIRSFNSGVVLYSKNARKILKEQSCRFDNYIEKVLNAKLPEFYTLDQNYLNAMIFSCDITWDVMDYKWNSVITRKNNTNKQPIIDYRKNPNFVHIQIPGKHTWQQDKTHRVVHNTISKWGFR